MRRSLQPHSPQTAFSRRRCLQVGGLGMLGVSLPGLMKLQASQPTGQPAAPAKSCIVLFLLGGPPQHETWDPKPDAPAEIRGDLRPIPSAVKGLHVGELMPLTAKLTDKIAVLRAVSTGDHAHSTSGYAMSTGHSHLPLGLEGAAPGPPNNWPCFGAVAGKLMGPRSALPPSITLPEIAANDPGDKTWPGQDAGFLGRPADPWILACDPAADDFTIPDLTLPDGLQADRLSQRLSLVRQLDTAFAHLDRTGAFQQFDHWKARAVNLLATPQARQAFDLAREPATVRDRYGRNKFGQSVLLARRLVEAGVGLVQVNWPRDMSLVNNGHWDTHTKNTEALKTVLMSPMDRAYSALLEDLFDRGLLDQTLVVWTGEFGRTPKINANGGRDHWGTCFSVALAGGGVRGGVVHGASDRLGAEPVEGRVSPADYMATLYHCLGLDPGTTIYDQLNRPHPLSQGRVIREIL